MTHAETICRYLESRPEGSTWGEVTAATKIGSPHRRVSGKESPIGWRLRTECRNGLWLHFARRLGGAVEGSGFQGAHAPGPVEREHSTAPIDGPALPDPTEAELDAALAKLGIARPRALA